jgi:hypothetical protein
LWPKADGKHFAVQLLFRRTSGGELQSTASATWCNDTPSKEFPRHGSDPIADGRIYVSCNGPNSHGPTAIKFVLCAKNMWGKIDVLMGALSLPGVAI